MSIEDVTRAEIRESDISQNEAVDLGGGLRVLNSGVGLLNSTLTANVAGRFGGAVLVLGEVDAQSEVEFINSYIGSNEAGWGPGFWVSDYSTLRSRHSTFGANSATDPSTIEYGIDGNGQVELSHTALWASQPATLGIGASASLLSLGYNAFRFDLNESRPQITLQSTDLESASFSADPLGEAAGSDLIDAGNATLVAGQNGVPLLDLNGIDRVLNNRIDIGAFEFDASLPIELLSFTAQPLVDGPVALSWQTASETDNAGFSVERFDAETDGFSEIAFITGVGTTTEGRSYHYRDPEPGFGLQRYRLKQLDFDGTASYSPEVEVTLEVPSAFVLAPVYPNPFNPTATVAFAVREAEPVEITLYNALGQPVRQLYRGTPEATRMHRVQLDGSGLSSGLYVVRLTSAAGTATQRVTFLK